MSNAAGDRGVLVRASPKPYGPPFMMLGFNLENTTSDAFRVTLTGRYLGYDVIGSGSELRIDGTLGSDPSVGLELYKPLGSTPLFVTPSAGVTRRSLDVIRDDAVVATYGQTVGLVGLGVGVNLGRESDLRVGAYFGRLDAEPRVGDPGLPALEGKESLAEGDVALQRAGQPRDPVVRHCRLRVAEVRLRRPGVQPAAVRPSGRASASRS